MANIAGTNSIGSIRMATRTALELVPRSPVALLAVPAFRTGARRVAGIDCNDRDACYRSLVADECPELVEGPTLHAGSLGLASRGPLPDAGEVFAGDRGVRVFRLGDDPLADQVVLIPPIGGFLLPDLAQLSLGALGAGLLACPPDATISGADPIHALAGEVLPVVGRGEVLHAQVDIDEINGVDRRVIGNVDCHQQEPLAVLAKHQVDLSLGAGKLLDLVLANQDRDDQASGQRPEIHSVEPDEPQDPGIVGDRGMLAELGLLVLVPLVGFADPVDDQDGGLRRESEPIAKLPVNQLLRESLVGNTTGEQFNGNPVRRLVKPLDGSPQLCVLDLVGNNLDLHSKLHT